MMWGYDFGWGWFMMSLSTILWLALLAVLIWAIIRWLDRKSNITGLQGPTSPTSGPSALEILRQRYARGEIDTTAFEQMHQRIENSTARESQSKI